MIKFKLISYSKLFNISCLWVRNWDEGIISMNAVGIDRGSQNGVSSSKYKNRSKKCWASRSQPWRQGMVHQLPLLKIYLREHVLKR
jgi:hypothetical protein